MESLLLLSDTGGTMEMDFDGIKKSIDTEYDSINKKIHDVKEHLKDYERQLKQYEGQLEKLAAAKMGLEGKGVRTASKGTTKGSKTSRTRRSDERMIEILKDANARGLTTKQIAEQQGVSVLSVYNWKKKHGAKAGFKSKKK
jgi:DNA-binding NarL/FixJ family response regulator